MPEERLQKILSQTGVTSRRKAEELIVQGRVTVNGEVITELGSKADIERDHIKVDGTLLHAPNKLVYLALHKPREVVTTVSDPEGRQTVMHLLRGVKERVFPVGRLDYSSEGLLLLTNDGEFAHRITAPASHVMKTYVVKVNGNLTDEQVKAFAAGIPLHGRKTAPAHIKLIKPGDNPWYEVRLSEGRQNQIRVMFKHFGKLVEKLRRVKIGFLELDLAPGRYRSLTPREIERFRHVLKLDQPDAQPVAEEPAEPAEPRPPRSAKPALLIRRPRRFAPKPEAPSEVPPKSAMRPQRTGFTPTKKGPNAPPSGPSRRPQGPSRFAPDKRGASGSPSGPSRRPPGPNRFDPNKRGPSGPPSGPTKRPQGPNRFDPDKRRPSGPPSGPSRRPPGPGRFDPNKRGPGGPPSGPSRRPQGPSRKPGGKRPSGPPRGKPRV